MLLQARVWPLSNTNASLRHPLKVNHAISSISNCEGCAKTVIPRVGRRDFSPVLSVNLQGKARFVPMETRAAWVANNPERRAQQAHLPRGNHLKV